MIKAVLFDWDGTLAQTLEVWLETFVEAFAEVGVYPTEEEICSHFGNLKSHIDLGVPEEDHDRYFKALEAVYERLKEVDLYSGAYDALVELKKNYKVGLVTSSNRNMINEALSNNRLSNFFDVIVSQEDTVKHKPDPEPLFVAMNHLDIQPEECIFIGDSDKDTGAAANANIPIVLYAPDTHLKYYDLEKLKKDISVANSFSDYKELINVLEKIYG